MSCGIVALTAFKLDRISKCKIQRESNRRERRKRRKKRERRERREKRKRRKCAEFELVFNRRSILIIVISASS
jgi:F0F1-type ATP synthase epsilon subunit